MEVGGEGDYYIYRYTVTTRMTPALRWAVMTAILMFHNCEGQTHKTEGEKQTETQVKKQTRGRKRER